jgi:hypothetical protein
MAVVLIATFVINLDSTTANVAIPAPGSQLRASTSGQQWVIDSSSTVTSASARWVLPIQRIRSSRTPLIPVTAVTIAVA